MITTHDGEEIGVTLAESYEDKDIVQFIEDILDVQKYSVQEKVMNHLKEQIDEFLRYRGNMGCPCCTHSVDCKEKDRVYCNMRLSR